MRLKVLILLGLTQQDLNYKASETISLQVIQKWLKLRK
jgi:hypothetical protein